MTTCRSVLPFSPTHIHIHTQTHIHTHTHTHTYIYILIRRIVVDCFNWITSIRMKFNDNNFIVGIFISMSCAVSQSVLFLVSSAQNMPLYFFWKIIKGQIKNIYYIDNNNHQIIFMITNGQKHMRKVCVEYPAFYQMMSLQHLVPLSLCST